jgi:transposase
MYIRPSTRKYKDKIYTNYNLVESVSTPKGPRQKAICSLGNLKPRPREEWLKLAHKVERALVGQGDLFDEDDPELSKIVNKVKARETESVRRQGLQQPLKDDDLVSIHTNRVTTERSREAGPVHVGYQFWKRLNLDQILTTVGLSKKARLLACAMTLNRLVHPCSELAMPDWIRRTALEDILETDFARLCEDALYRNMDRLYPNRVSIESMLAKQEQTLFNLEQTILLYDLTSTYFEGQALKNSKAKRGYSRDKRPDCKQVVVGLVINKDGFPLAHEIFEGNTQDRQTLADMLDLLDRRVGIQPGQTVVIDRGMAFDENLEQIASRDLHYIVATRQCERDRWLDDFNDLDGFEKVVRLPSPLNPFQKKPTVLVKMKQSEDHAYVLCISSGRKEKDKAIREKKEKKLLTDVEKLLRRIKNRRLVKPVKIGEAIGRIKERYPLVARYYHLEYDISEKKLICEVDKKRKEKAEDLDGSYLLKSDRTDLTAEEAWRIYSLLTRAENAFRNMKSPLAERPIFHQIERRTDTHIFLCVLAYHLLVAIEKTLLDKEVHTSWKTVREILSSHQVMTVVLPTDKGSVIRIRKSSTPELEHKKLYDLLDIPHQVMRPKKIWSE